MVLGEPAVSPTASDMGTGGHWENPGERAEATINHAASSKHQATDETMSVPSGPGAAAPRVCPQLPPGVHRNTSERLLMASTCASRCQYSIQGERKNRIKKAQRDEGGSRKPTTR